MGGGRMRAPPPRAAGIGGAESLSAEGWEEGGWSVVMATGSPVALAARREGRRRDRQGPADPCVWGGGRRAPSAWPRHCCDMPPAWPRVLHAKMQMSGRHTQPTHS